jgi:CDP-diacylglycerol--serine O-phosphatidyltransferase
MGRAIIVVPSIFTLANLFFGVWAMVLAAQGDFYRAGWWIVIAGVLDMLDGLLARVSNTGSRFGAELDSLVDMVSFGIAPGVLLYHMHFASQGPWGWVFCYGYAVCVALRLARYNMQSDGTRRAFVGLPSPAAGMTLATYFPFTQSQLFQEQLAAWPWNQVLVFMPIVLGLAMVSNIEYARVPRIGVRTRSGLLGLGFHLTIIGFAIFSRDVFFFPFGIAYVGYGMARAAAMGFLERGDEDGGADGDAAPRPRMVRDLRMRRRRRGGGTDLEV